MKTHSEKQFTKNRNKYIKLHNNIILKTRKDEY